MLDEAVLWIERAKEFGPLLSGVGSLCAVIVALHLASNKSRERLSVNVADVWFTTTFKMVNVPHYVCVHVTNFGELPVTISFIGWKIGWFRSPPIKSHPTQIDNLGEQLPALLGYGAEANMAIFNFLSRTGT